MELPLRFRTEEDAIFFLNCMKNHANFPSEKFIHPFVMVGGVYKFSPAYLGAPFELTYTYGPVKKLVNV